MGDASGSTSSFIIVIKISKNKHFIMKTQPGAIGVKKPEKNIGFSLENYNYFLHNDYLIDGVRI